MAPSSDFCLRIRLNCGHLISVSTFLWVLWRGGALQRLSKGSALGEVGEAAQHVQGLAEEVQGAETRGITESEGVEELAWRDRSPPASVGGGMVGGEMGVPCTAKRVPSVSYFFVSLVRYASRRRHRP